jgi:hypothetical protein
MFFRYLESAGCPVFYSVWQFIICKENVKIFRSFFLKKQEMKRINKKKSLRTKVFFFFEFLFQE